MSYNDLVLTLFFDPKHAGLIEQNQGYRIAKYVDASKTQQIDFYIEFSSDRKISSIRYLVKGNPYTIAGAEWMAKRVEKSQDGAILKEMTANYWHDLFDISKRDKRTAISLSQAATCLYDLIR